jgi:translation elongation factor P
MFRSTLVAALVAGASAFAPNSLPVRTTTALEVAVDTSEIKNGMTIELDGEPYKVLNFSIMKQARGAAKTTIKFKNLKTQNTIENTYRSGEKFETAEILREDAQFTYADEMGNYFFMNSETFEEVMVESKVVDEQKKWIVEGMEVSLINFKGTCIEVVPPKIFTFEIVETEPSLKGNTSGAHTKPAVLSSGAVVTVPGFVEQGTLIKVDTEKGTYVERA